MKPTQILTDVGVGVGLFLALVFVFLLDPRTGAVGPSGPQLEHTVIPGQATADRKPIKMAVSTPPGYDKIQEVLDRLGKGFKDAYTIVGFEDFRKVEELEKYDIAFLTCNNSRRDDFALNTALRQFVERGGTLYSSDLRFDAIAGAFPEFLHPNLFDFPPGVPQPVGAKIVDQELVKKLKDDQIMLRFDSGGWKPAAFRRDKVKLADGTQSEVMVYLEGEYRPTAGQPRRSPLLVSFPVGKKGGAVVFTSFHNSKQDDPRFPDLLNYLVFRTVTKKAEQAAVTSLIEGGLNPAQSSLISVNTNNPKVERTYENPKAGKVRFVLAFNAGQGAKLKLTVRSPDGKVAEHQDDKTFTIEVPNAAVGRWDLTVTALEMPGENFPFNVLVATPKE